MASKAVIVAFRAIAVSWMLPSDRGSRSRTSILLKILKLYSSNKTADWLRSIDRVLRTSKSCTAKLAQISKASNSSTVQMYFKRIRFASERILSSRYQDTRSHQV